MLDLKDALRLQRKVVDRRSSIPVLTGVLVGVNKSGLAIVGTDLDRTLETLVPMKAMGRGQIVVSLEAFDAAVKLLKGDIGVTFEQERLVLSNGTVTHNVPKLADVSDYPPRGEAVDWGVAFSAPDAGIDDVLYSVGYAISYEETRYYLNGIYVCLRKGKLEFVATDGHRLALQRIRAPKVKGWQPQIWPAKTCDVLEAAVNAVAEGEVKVVQDKKATRVRFDLPDQVTLWSKCIDGSFPDYDRVIPSDGFKTTVQVKTREALELMKQVVTGKRRRQGESEVAVLVAGPVLKLARDATHEDANPPSVELPGEVSGDQVAIGFNARYLVNTLERGEGPATIQIGDPTWPMLFTFEGLDGCAVLMPMRHSGHWGAPGKEKPKAMPDPGAPVQVPQAAE
jgi:DNA polymerase-3 subunit beta